MTTPTTISRQKTAQKQDSTKQDCTKLQNCTTRLHKNKFGSKIKTHYFNVGNEVDVDGLIDKVKDIHATGIL